MCCDAHHTSSIHHKLPRGGVHVDVIITPSGVECICHELYT